MHDYETGLHRLWSLQGILIIVLMIVTVFNFIDCPEERNKEIVHVSKINLDTHLIIQWKPGDCIASRMVIIIIIPVHISWLSATPKQPFIYLRINLRIYLRIIIR